MANTTDFRNMASLFAGENKMGLLLPAIEKELLHYEILQAMDKARYLERLTFQGGTCLRLCYGAERLSEDLDFVGGPEFDLEQMHGLHSVLVSALENRYAVEVEVVDPSNRNDEVFSWQVKIVTAPERPDIPKQRISIQIATVPAHTREVCSLTVNYAGLPSSYANTLVLCESKEEICADKLKAFITSSYIRYRDLWDMRWLTVQPNFDTSALPVLFAHKLQDYQAADLFDKQLGRLDMLDEIVNSKEFLEQMQRFIPAPVLAETLERPLFCQHLLKCIKELYSLVL